jgi:hypothetical protein
MNALSEQERFLLKQSGDDMYRTTFAVMFGAMAWGKWMYAYLQIFYIPIASYLQESMH